MQINYWLTENEIEWANWRRLTFCKQPRYASSVSSITTPSSYLSPVPLCTPGSASLAPSTLGVGHSVASTPRVGREPLTAEEMATDYCCWGKFPLLHFLVISLLIGITLLIVGLVQLKPNADSEAKKYLFLGSAAACFVMGFFFMAIRRLRLHHYRKCLNKNRPALPKDDSNYSITFSGAENDKLSPMDSTALLLPQRLAHLTLNISLTEDKLSKLTTLWGGSGHLLDTWYSRDIQWISSGPLCFLVK